VVGEPERPSQGGAHHTRETAYEDVYTVVHDLGEARDIAWIRGSIWPPVGTVVELERPNRHALVIGIRLVLLDGDHAVVRVDVQDPGAGEFIARDAATRLVEHEEEPLLAVSEKALEGPSETAY
jgi:hypothetical protein